MPDQYLACLEAMCDMGFFPSRSEGVRQALKRFLDREQNINKRLDPEIFIDLKKNQLESMVQIK